jgi:hypothetical protein
MTTFRLKKTNGLPPKIAMIKGTHPKYGLDRNWRSVSRSPVHDTDEYACTVDDGILEIFESDGRNYYSVHGDRIVKLDGIVPRAIAKYMSENRCSRNDAWRANLRGVASGSWVRRSHR